MPLNLIVVEYISHWKKAILVWCWIALGFFLQQEKISILMLSLWFMVQNKPSILMWMMVVGVLWWCGEKGLCSVLFPSRHAPRKIRICEEQGSKGRLDSNPCQVVLAQYPWGLKSHDPFAWNIVLLLLILCRWIHNCIHVSEIWLPICLKNRGVVVLAHTSQMDLELYPCFWNLTTIFLKHCAVVVVVVDTLQMDPELYPRFADWIHNCILGLEIWLPFCLKHFVAVVVDNLQMDPQLYPCFGDWIHNWIHNGIHDFQIDPQCMTWYFWILQVSSVNAMQQHSFGWYNISAGWWCNETKKDLGCHLSLSLNLDRLQFSVCKVLEEFMCIHPYSFSLQVLLVCQVLQEGEREREKGGIGEWWYDEGEAQSLAQ